MQNSVQQPILICTDLDRTLIPNGIEEESPGARALFTKLVEHPSLRLAYVTGRHKKLIEQVIDEFHLPVPDFAIGDVGTTIYRVDGQSWQPWGAWWDAIGSDWAGKTGSELAAVLADLSALRLQEPEKQNRYKLSYYTDPNVDRKPLFAEISQRLSIAGARVNLIWSVDDLSGLGLLDILPRCADKLEAIRFLIAHEGYAESRTVFFGDSGNDLPALTSGLPAVLVANGHPETRQEALGLARERGIANQLYLARGNFLGMNGNYSAGILEGLAHFQPETLEWMQAARAD